MSGYRRDRMALIDRRRIEREQRIDACVREVFGRYYDGTESMRARLQMGRVMPMDMHWMRVVWHRGRVMAECQGRYAIRPQDFA